MMFHYLCNFFGRNNKENNNCICDADSFLCPENQKIFNTMNTLIVQQSGFMHAIQISCYIVMFLWLFEKHYCFSLKALKDKDKSL